MPATLAHLDAMIEAGVHGMILLGTVGENCSLEYAEKLAVRCRYGRFVRKVLRLPVPTRPHVVFLPGAVVRIYTLNIAGNIIAYEDRARRWKPSSAPCGLMVVRDTAKPLPPGHARTATVRDGTYKGLTIRVGSAGVYWRS